MRLFIHPALEASHVPLLMGTAPSDPAEIIAVVPERNGPGRWSDGQDHPEVDPTRTPVWEDGRSAVIEAPAPVAELLKTIRAVGRATEQARYEMLARETFAQLDAFDARLAAQRYLSGSQEPGLEDMWLFAVLVRFDSAYYGFYKLTQRRIASYPQLGPWLRDLYQRDGVANTVQWTTIVRHFAWESEGTNPKRLVPRGGIPDLRVPHDRWRFHPQAQDGSGAIEEDPSRPRRPGEWVRPQSGHRDWISVDGSTGFRAEPGRYHLYIANNCPWCHRVAITRALKGLEQAVSLDVLYYRRDPERGWQFRPDEPGCTADTVNGVDAIQELYARVGSSERSVPVLWDRQTQTIVNNESAEIIRMLNGAFEAWATADLDLYPEPLRAEIDHINQYTYVAINNGAYKAGFARSQEVYNTWHDNVFAALDWLDQRLKGRPFLVGDRLTEADVRLLPTIFRFEPVYVVRFRLNARRIADYDHLSAWLERMMAIPALAAASNLDHCRRGYFGRTGNNLVPIPTLVEA